MSALKDSIVKAWSALGALRDVESIIKGRLGSEAPLVEEVCKYLLSLGGKRIRPILTLMCGKALGLDASGSQRSPAQQQLLEVAAGIELIHMATLLHDDIIDRSPLRRHKQSPFVKYGTDNTLLCGDFLLVRAFGLCAHLDQYIVNATEEACVALTEGEIIETCLTKTRHNLAGSLEIARKKTAALFKLASISAAHLAGANAEVCAQMALYGEKLGVVFQVVDDILDITSNEDLLGKKTGQDLHERKPSVVNVLWLESGSALSAKLLEPPTQDEPRFLAAAMEEIKSSGIIAQAKELAVNYSVEASRALKNAVTAHMESVPPKARHKCLETLEDLLRLDEYVMERVS